MDKNNLGIPVAIIIVGLLIAGAIMFGGNGRSLNLGGGNVEKEVSVRPADTTDHLQGALGAPVTVIEYSDLECPYCKVFHNTMNEALAAYNGGEEVKLAWVFRHFPLDSLHSKARAEAAAAECAGELGGSKMFWTYIDKIFAVTPSNDGLDSSLLPVLAQEIGLDRGAFEKCQAANKYAEKIQASYEEAIAAGGTGTPFVIVIGPSGQQIALPGAVPLEDLKQAIDSLLK